MDNESQGTSSPKIGNRQNIPAAYLKALTFIGAAIVVLLVIIVVKLFSESQENTAANTNTTQESGATTSPNTNDGATTPTPDHNYVYEKNGIYGYQQQLSQDDINAGTASKPLDMVKYLGQKNGVYRVLLIDESDGSASNLLSCSPPCTYMTIETLYAGQSMNKQTIPTVGTLGGDILNDAMNGKLKIYGQKDKTE